MSGIGPNKRPTALIFQNLALFPLMTVADNISLWPARARRRQDGAARRPMNCSTSSRCRPGRQAGQRIVRRPEAARGHCPRAGGGAQGAAARRTALGAGPETAPAHAQRIARHPAAVGITFIYITHDQGEALTMSDRIAVMSDGVIQQVADGKTVYDAPQTPFVASFVGENNPFIRHGQQSRRNSYAVVDTPSVPCAAATPVASRWRQGHPVRAAGITRSARVLPTPPSPRSSRMWPSKAT
jgi:spermidine/putrescine transport system ATP-binding protein